MKPLGEEVLDRTHSRYQGSRGDAYTRSYRLIRLVVGFLGVALPLLFIFVEAFLLRGGVHVRGSLSAYYHSPLQDIFVAGLCVIGFLLATYMAGEPRSWDFWVSLIAGIALIGVVFFPTSRSGLPSGAPLCGALPQPAGCSFVEQAFGEHTTALIHAGFAVAFILGLAVMSFLFAASEVQPNRERATEAGLARLRNPALFWAHITCGLVIVVAGAWAFVGADIWILTRLYIGEVAAVWAFGISWLLAGFRMTAPARHAPTHLASVPPTEEEMLPA
jgi:hypothetical protein